jgi:hypothetical protein
MKKLFFLVALAFAVMANAQVLEVASVQKLNIPDGDVKVAGIAPDGSYVLLTTNSNQGLRKFDLANETMTTLSTAAGAGYNASISADGATVVYRETSFDSNRLRQQSLKSQNIISGKKQQLVNNTRSARKLAVSGNLMAARPTCSIEDRQLMITIGGTTTQLSPCGTDKSYIWPSVSPNGRKVLFYVCGNGAYVCNLDGSGLQYLGHNLRAPKWYNDNVVIGMNDKDNGETVISSEIVAVNLNGQSQVLTNGIDAMYPYACNGKIVCSGLNGETYLISLR